MPQRSSSGRGGTATATRSRPGSRTGTQISEADIAQMRVDEIRAELRSRGVTGTSGMRKPDLVEALATAMRAERRRGGTAARKPTGPARGAGRRGAAGAGGRGGAGEQARGGRSPSRSLKYAQRIATLEDRPERPGRSLVTTNHEVIQRWARARQAKPATIAGTEREGRAGVLTFNLPGYRESSRIRQITWDEWFRTFDERRLNLIYQEQMRDGRQSNFFRTESPEREDG